MERLKNWWFTILFIIGGVLDLGFDLFNPMLIDLGLSPKVITIIKIAFVIYGVVKLKLSLPNSNNNNNYQIKTTSMRPITVNWDLISSEAEENNIDHALSYLLPHITIEMIGTRPKHRPK